MTSEGIRSRRKALECVGYGTIKVFARADSPLGLLLSGETPKNWPHVEKKPKNRPKMRKRCHFRFRRRHHKNENFSYSRSLTKKIFSFALPCLEDAQRNPQPAISVYCAIEGGPEHCHLRQNWPCSTTASKWRSSAPTKISGPSDPCVRLC
jgi:hypothetical protein